VAPYLQQDEVGKLLKIARDRGLPRNELLSQLSPVYVSSLPISSTPQAQLLSDLGQLNRQAPLTDGTVPLRSWLKSALLLLEGQQEAAAVEDALQKVEKKVLAAYPSDVASTSSALSTWDQGDVEELVTQRLGAHAQQFKNPSDALPVVTTAARGKWLDDLLVAAISSRLDAALVQVAEKRGLAVKVPVESGALQRLVRATAKFQDVAAWRTKLAALESVVCRVEIDGKPQGTAFLVGPDLVLTNHHVVATLVDKKDVSGLLQFRFDYKRSAETHQVSDGVTVKPGLDWLRASAKPAPFEQDTKLPPGEPAADELDFALIGLERAIGNEPVGTTDAGAKGRSRGWIRVQGDPVLTRLEVGDQAFILEHPLGDPLQLAVGTITKPLERRVRYDVNTQAGSSGSPCLNAALDLVALHHFGDPAYSTPTYNQGIPVHLIAAFCAAKGITFSAPPA
jgi:Effector-associated domain 5/Trypsin-like peptidase domain